MVSIGPYHYDKDKLKLGEALKLKLTQQFFRDREPQIEVLHDKIFKEIGELRGCYDEEPTNKYDDEALAWMLFVDGCSVLRYIHCYADKKFDELKIKNHEIAFVRQDLFLLENQLSFQVLKLLMSDNGMEKIEKFILENWRKQPTPPPPQQKPQPPPPQQQPEIAPCHLLELFRTELVGKPSKQDENTGNKEEDWQSFRDVTVLRAAGIHLKRSKTNCLHDVSFTYHLIFGYLSLPPLVVDDSTKAKFLNLIACEMCPEFDNKFEVTSYICFLDSLIDQADDVKKLRKKHILHNFLGSDEEVAKLFNEIATDLVPSFDIYRHVKADIQKHYDDIGKAWMAEFVHNHFSSPWTFIAFIAAVAAFAFSVVPYIKKDQK
ncbi:hypothetical protein L1049_008455 [Liquidambar formosana]|uniref:Uncharacterized protein n=1 Tax=Liquidambar formosana TaxID=63359 RepID=A0AAP0X8A5_LIQFO